MDVRLGYWNVNLPKNFSEIYPTSSNSPIRTTPYLSDFSVSPLFTISSLTLYFLDPLYTWESFSFPIILNPSSLVTLRTSFNSKNSPENLFLSFYSRRLKSTIPSNTIHGKGTWTSIGRSIKSVVGFLFFLFSVYNRLSNFRFKFFFLIEMYLCNWG